MKGEWAYFNGLLSKGQCEQIIKDGLTIPSNDATIGVTDGKTDNSHRRSKVRFLLRSDKRFEWIFDMLWKSAMSANNDFFGFHLSKLDYVQMAEYESSYKGEYKEHHDVFWLNGDQVYHRKLSCILQLSDPATYDGGDLVITEATQPLDKECKSQGSLIFFPSMLRHKAEPVTRGTRYSLAAWFDGPKWR